MLKAYVFANALDSDVDIVSKEITFAESPGKAKQDFSISNGVHYKDIRVKRLPWADIYEDVKNIPPAEWFAHGFMFTCATCGKTIEELFDYCTLGDHHICSKCFDEWSNDSDNKTTVSEMSYDVRFFHITEYKCDSCGESFYDRDDNYKYCPYCGRKIDNDKENDNKTEG